MRYEQKETGQIRYKWVSRKVNPADIGTHIMADHPAFERFTAFLKNTGIVKWSRERLAVLQAAIFDGIRLSEVIVVYRVRLLSTTCWRTPLFDDYIILPTTLYDHLNDRHSCPILGACIFGLVFEPVPFMQPWPCFLLGLDVALIGYFPKGFSLYEHGTPLCRINQPPGTC